MATNCEYGAFDDAHVSLSRTKYDVQIGEESPRPGQQTFEKLSAGLYLGEIFRLILVELADRGLVFKGQERNGDGKLRERYSIVAAICLKEGIKEVHVAADGSVANKHAKFKKRWAKALGGDIELGQERRKTGSHSYDQCGRWEWSRVCNYCRNGIGEEGKARGKSTVGNGTVHVEARGRTTTFSY